MHLLCAESCLGRPEVLKNKHFRSEVKIYTFSLFPHNNGLNARLLPNKKGTLNKYIYDISQQAE